MKDKKEKKSKESSSSRKSEDGRDAELKPTKKLLSFTRSKKPSKKTQEAESLKVPDFNDYRDLIEDSDDGVPESGEPVTFFFSPCHTGVAHPHASPSMQREPRRYQSSQMN